MILGQFLGFTLVLLCALPGFFGGLIVPKEWIGLLGIIPIIMGIKELWKLWKRRHDSEEESNDSEQEIELVAARNDVKSPHALDSEPVDASLVSSQIKKEDQHEIERKSPEVLISSHSPPSSRSPPDLKRRFEKRDEKKSPVSQSPQSQLSSSPSPSADKNSENAIEQKDDEEEKEASSSNSFLRRFLHRNVVKVMALTFGNGGDNIAVYVPLFASSSLPKFLVILVVFYILLGLFCLVSFQFTRFPRVARLIDRYGEKITPLVLIGLGIYILIDNESYSLIGDLF